MDAINEYLLEKLNGTTEDILRVFQVIKALDNLNAEIDPKLIARLRELYDRKGGIRYAAEKLVDHLSRGLNYNAATRYTIGDVVVFMLPIQNDRGLLARRDDLGLIVGDTPLIDQEHNIHWIANVYVNGHSGIGVGPEEIRKATDEETRRFWDDQADVYSVHVSSLDGLLGELRSTKKVYDKALLRIQRLESL